MNRLSNNYQETLLLVDDNPTNLQVLYQTLEGHGYKLLLAKNGEDALNIINKVHPALVLLDIMMPGMDGYEVCQQIKSNADIADVAIIFLSALDDVKDKVKGFKSGAVDYISKPFQSEEVIARVETHIKIRQLEKTLEQKNKQLEEDNILILEFMGEGLLGVDKQGQITFINPAGSEIIGSFEDEIIGKSFHDLLMHTDKDGHRNPVEKDSVFNTLRDQRVRQSDNDIFWNKEGHSFPVEYTVTAIEGDEDISSACVVFKNISERKQREKDLNNALKTVEELKEKLQEENTYLRAESSYLQEEIRNEQNYGEIIGNSDALIKTMEEAQQVAQTDTTVLINGESGTGKESMARAIHQYSNRKDRPLIKVNCGAIAESLVESELFGHVKGAFTSAISDRTGHFELADKGTIFLDEIGELSLDVQVKLLRVLQEQEIQRVGSGELINVDVRIIAATNRDLKKMVDDGMFRMDLFYRLNVFPLTVPPLRDRKSDIPLLLAKFLDNLSKKLGKSLKGVSDVSMELLMDYHWPGNIRELQNVIERSAILSKTDIVEVDDALVPVSIGQVILEENNRDRLSDAEGNEPLNRIEKTRYKTLAENEKCYITRLLEELHWVIGGKKGVAEILDVPASTLRSRMKKLGIERPD
ncbi:MAG: sigma-54-dependent Fis family transcriptional regulator [gamma proteobacterium symbiont of Bathyaustriella thionipta]|nr:sigma-54-dependent Fis family transcriptional regulator [gamma proteobacterium symbiont of Bathyaustriella thionipta]MCU7951489.1 sigma-54-dependent Fis family transcriptional regulator [gamma proteobacterium symbiont of Bathyaustriella thionipta]MCU7951887.1 sigma-54-dependent Fis family transcriptional regulator [gamma proteobacterium symbiont of Bathyaustriella thionipta]MCU7958055.1 sigma-54-dependent Fis family transcriptional regulator [gamma proteobacterium symbiont of Bathyaustriella 